MTIGLCYLPLLPMSDLKSLILPGHSLKLLDRKIKITNDSDNSIMFNSSKGLFEEWAGSISKIDNPYLLEELNQCLINLQQKPTAQLNLNDFNNLCSLLEEAIYIISEIKK